MACVSAGGDTNDVARLSCPDNRQQAHLRYRLLETCFVEHVFEFFDTPWCVSVSVSVYVSVYVSVSVSVSVCLRVCVSVSVSVLVSMCLSLWLCLCL